MSGEEQDTLKWFPGWDISVNCLQKWIYCCVVQVGTQCSILLSIFANLDTEVKQDSELNSQAWVAKTVWRALFISAYHSTLTPSTKLIVILHLSAKNIISFCLLTPCLFFPTLSKTIPQHSLLRIDGMKRSVQYFIWWQLQSCNCLEE